jgi:NADPH:quinone reductase-like Zn-dependent oxidoreductase
METGRSSRRNFYAELGSDGPPTPAKTKGALGGDIDGVLAESVVLNEAGLVAVPAHLSFEEAATLPCAAVTAWNALATPA